MKCPKPQWVNDNWCDDMNNIEACNWDGGDCCGTNVRTKYCTVCQCLDPNFCEDDDDSYCEENFNTLYSFCQTNPDYANKCKKTCGKCEGPCQDKLPVYWCNNYKEIGNCKLSWMKKKCKKTCEIPCNE